MADIPLIRPVGPFYWEAKLNGELCLCDVTWECSYVGDGPISIPPRVSFFEEYVVVSPRLEPDVPVPALVTPGVLTLTPTTICPTSDPENPLVTVWDPIYLTITEFGLSSSGCPNILCPYPENPGFETGGLTGWVGLNGATTTTTQVYAGTYAAILPNVNSGIEQLKYGMCPGSGTLVVDFYAYAAAASSLRIVMRQYSGDTLLDEYVVDPVAVAAGTWSYISTSRTIQPTTTGVRFSVGANHVNIFVDEFTCNLCP